MDKEKLIMEIEELNTENQSIIGTDEEVKNDYADGYEQAVNDIIEMIKSKF